MSDSSKDMAGNDQKHLFENAALCKYLLDEIDASSYLAIRPSLIAGAGSALFATKHFTAGEEIFRSSPVVSTVLDTAQNVCDYCFRDGDSRLHPSGRFRAKNESVEVLPACKECGLLRYCSEVGSRSTCYLLVCSK